LLGIKSEHTAVHWPLVIISITDESSEPGAKTQSLLVPTKKKKQRNVLTRMHGMHFTSCFALYSCGRRSTCPQDKPTVFQKPIWCHSTEPGRHFCKQKMGLTHTSDVIQAMRRGPDPNRLTYGSKEALGYYLGGLSGRFFPRQ